MSDLAQIMAAMQRWYPSETAEAWDAVGLSCGDPATPVSHVLLAVDCVPATVEEAVSLGAQLLLTHHPLLMTAVHSVSVSEPKGAMVHRMIRAGVAHFAAHTNADIALEGVSQALADRLELTGTRPIAPVGIDSPIGSGRIGQLAQDCSLEEFAAVVAHKLPRTSWGVRGAGDPAQRIRTVAVCGGSGGGYAASARAQGADVLVTADLKHHTALESVTERVSADRGVAAPMALIDAAHWATEAPWLDVLARLLRVEFDIEVTVSAIVTDPWAIHVH